MQYINSVQLRGASPFRPVEVGTGSGQGISPAKADVARRVLICWQLHMEEEHTEGERSPQSHLVGMTTQGGVWSAIHWSEALLATLTGLVSEPLLSCDRRQLQAQTRQPVYTAAALQESAQHPLPLPLCSE
jgi:hypothetical protein